MSTETTRIRVKLFAVAREAAGADFVDLDVPSDEPSTPQISTADCSTDVAALKRAFFQRLPMLAYAAKQLLFAVDGEYATAETRVTPQSEVACIPPVSGG